MNILNRKFVDLDSKSQIEFNRQKNVSQDQRLSDHEVKVQSLQSQIDVLAEGAVSNYMPLIWTRDEGQQTYRMSSIESFGNSEIGAIYQLVPLGADSNSYISAIVERTSSGWNTILKGDYEENFTKLVPVEVKTGLTGEELDVILNQETSSYLYEYPAQENEAARVKVMRDSDGNTREYTSVDVNGDGEFDWIRYGTIHNGIDGRSVYEVNSNTWEDVKLNAKDFDVLVASETFNDGVKDITSGDVGVYRPDLGDELNFTVGGNIHGEQGIQGQVGLTGPRGATGHVYLGKGVYERSGAPTEGLSITVGFASKFNGDIANVVVGDPFLLSYKDSAGNKTYIVSGSISAVPPTSSAGQVELLITTIMAATGETGAVGASGEDGIGIESVVSSKEGPVTTVLITMTDASVKSFTVSDGENALPFLIAEGVFTTSTLPAYGSASANTGYIVLNTTPPVNTYDLYVKSGNATDWTVVTSWGGVPGPTGKSALSYGNVIIINTSPLAVPNTFTTSLATYNRTPIVGDKCLYGAEVVSAGKSIRAIITGTIAQISGSTVTVTTNGSSVIPNGIDGKDTFTIDLGTLTEMPQNISTVEYTVDQIVGRGAVEGSKAFTVVFVDEPLTQTFLAGYGTITSVATALAPGTLDLSKLVNMMPTQLVDEGTLKAYLRTNITLDYNTFEAPAFLSETKAGTLISNADETLANGTRNITNTTNGIVYQLSIVDNKTGLTMSGMTLKSGVAYNVTVDANNNTIKLPMDADVDLTNYYTKGQTDTKLQNEVDTKVDKITGKGLSTEDYTSGEKSKLAGIQAGAQVNAVTSVAGRTGAVTITKTDVGLGNVNNTSDQNKPISNATQAALNTKQSKLQTVSDEATAETQSLANPDNFYFYEEE